MRGALLLLVHSIRRVRTLVLTIGVLLSGFQIVLVLVARSIQQSRGFEQLAAMLPPFVKELLGPALASLMSFAGIVCVGYFHLAVMGSLVALSIALATIPASEVETGFMDLILARPFARHWVITRTILVVILSIAVVLALMITGTWTGLETLADRTAAWPSANLILTFATNLGLLMLCWSAVAMTMGSASLRRSVAGAVTGLLALITFLLDYVGRLWKPAESIAWLSPFRYYSPNELLLGEPLPMRNIAVLGGIAVVGFAAAYALFLRRDITH